MSFAVHTFFKKNSMNIVGVLFYDREVSYGSERRQSAKQPRPCSDGRKRLAGLILAQPFGTSQPFHL